MNPDWLKQLAPDRAPASPSWWPLAIGWWLLIAIVVLLLVAAWWWRQSRFAKQRRQQRIALEALRRIELLDDHQVAAREIQHLLRRYALTLFGHERVARLSGNKWLQFIIAHGGEAFAGESGQSLLSAAFGKNASASHREQWLLATQAFIRRAPKLRRHVERR